jgi:hypothetical protein
VASVAASTVSATATASLDPAASATQTTSPDTRSAPAMADVSQLIFPTALRLDYLLSDIREGQINQIQGNLEWFSDGGNYRMRLSASKLLLTVLNQTSEGTIGEGGLQPTRFAETRFNRSEQAVHFDAAQQRIRFSNNQPDAPMLAGTQDRLSMLMQLSAMVVGNTEQFTLGASVSLPVASVDEASLWRWESLGYESLGMPNGIFNTLHLQRQPRSEFDPKLELWLAADYGFLPMRLLRTERNGNLQDLQLQTALIPESQGSSSSP